MAPSFQQVSNRIAEYALPNQPTKVSDLIADYLSWVGVHTAFVVQGGCAVHLIDSADRHERMHVVPMQHEQAGAMAADAVSRTSDQIGLAIATSGPGATNLLTGVCCSFYDSVPAVILTGQVPSGHLKGSTGSRQVGFQETDVVSIFEPVTKFASLLSDPSQTLQILDEAVLTAVSSRMGPVLVDICDDVQRAVVIPNELPRYSRVEDTSAHSSSHSIVATDQQIALRHAVEQAQRPLIIVGAGAGNSASKVYEFLERSTIPFLCTWAVVDRFSFLDSAIGTFGTTSNRSGNFAVQSADLIIALGTRLDSHEIGNNQAAFAPDATKVMVDLDRSEINKFRQTPVHIDIGIPVAIEDFLSWALSDTGMPVWHGNSEWLDFLTEVTAHFPACSPADRSQRMGVNPYFFMEVLSELLPDDAIVVPDCGSNLIWTMQGLTLRSNRQRLFSAWNHSPMGYALPAAAGCATLSASRPVVCLTGDGGLQMNIQELSTLERQNLNVKLIILNNHGHGIIQGTQDQWLEGRHVASNVEGGLPDPDYAAICNAYGITALTIPDHSQLRTSLEDFLTRTGPVACVVDMLPQAQIYPKLLAGAPLHEMSPAPSSDILESAGIYIRSTSGDSRA
jgi:acetolactate synthase-1/2/3 large subunit